MLTTIKLQRPPVLVLCRPRRRGSGMQNPSPALISKPALMAAVTSLEATSSTARRDGEIDYDSGLTETNSSTGKPRSWDP